MEKEIIENISYRINELIKKNDFIDAKIEHILINKQNPKDSIALISEQDYDLHEIRLINDEICPAFDWNYNVDDDIFAHLENEYEIGFISLKYHSCIWSEIDDIGIEEFNHKIGMQKYLKYCKDNNINKKYIDEKLKIDVGDIMKYYDEKTDYIKIEDGYVKIPTEKYQKEIEKNYLSFCLGYDLLNCKLGLSNKRECDLEYDFCNNLINKFMESEHYKNRWQSTYDNLRDWINDNDDIIVSEYLKHFKLDNKCILDMGNRGKTKIALVERTTKYGKDYIIAFDYTISNEKIEWEYGYYCNEDLEKAKQEFENVKAGEDLTENFSDIGKYQEIKKDMETILKDDEEYSEYKIECILIDNKDIYKSYGIAMYMGDVAIVDMEKRKMHYIYNAEYTFDIGDDSIFPSLQKGKMEIAYISMEAHYALWQEIDRYYPNDIKNKNGVQMYLKYCKENNITKELIGREKNYDKTPDIMRFQEKNTKNNDRDVR